MTEKAKTPKKPKAALCGHINEHAMDVDKKAKKVSYPRPKCTKPKGHEGNHTDGKSTWRDEAGTPTARGLAAQA